MQRSAWFLPAWPPPFGELAVFGALLLAGLLGGELVHRLLALPRITGYVLAGIACGPQALGLVHGPLLTEARVFVDLALGLILFELGHRLDFDWLRAQPLAVGGGDRRERGRLLRHLLPALLLLRLRAAARRLRRRDRHRHLARGGDAGGAGAARRGPDHRAHAAVHRGQLRVRLRGADAAAAAGAPASTRPSWRSALLHPVYLLAAPRCSASPAASCCCGWPRWLGKREDRQFVLLVALIVLVVGLARAR